MTPEREKELAAAFGIDKMPQTRYDDLPELDPEVASRVINFKKALACVDVIETAAFERYIPTSIVIDQSIDTRTFSPSRSLCIHVPCDRPLPVNKKLTAATGIGRRATRENLYTWLGQELLWQYNTMGLRAISPPLVFRAKAMLGVMVTLDDRPKDGLTRQDMRQSIGLLLPPGIESENRVIPTLDAPPIELDKKTADRLGFNSRVES